jgi:hypothetical protein
MNGPDTTPPFVMSASGQGDTQPLGTVAESLNTKLEVAIRYPQPRRLTATTVTERQRPSLPKPSKLDSISAKNATNWQHVRTKRVFAG